MKRKRIRTNHTEKDGRNNDSAHYHVLKSRIRIIEETTRFFTACYLAHSPSQNGRATSKISTDIPFGNPDSCGISSDPEGR